MSISTFKIELTGQYFHYDNKQHMLFSDEMKPLLKEPSQDLVEETKQRFGKRTKTNSPETIKISLGHGCNYSCAYCMQKDIGNPNERPKNIMTSSLIKSVRETVNLSELTRFELWGGETLLYWKDIVSLMTAFDKEELTWYIPTNGTPLQHKHIDFFMQLKGRVAIGISHDGPAHVKLRGKEFLDKKVSVFKRIQDECQPKIQFSFNPVISISNYDLFEIDTFFQNFLKKYDLKPVTLNFELARVYDKDMAENSTHHVIVGEHVNRYHKILHEYLNQHILQFEMFGNVKTGKLLANSLFHTGMGVLPYVKSLHNGFPYIVKTNCGVDDSKLVSLDLNGNVRTCQNTDESYNSGHINNFKGIEIKGITFERTVPCDTCPVLRLCKSSCPLDLGDQVFFTNHNIERIHYGEIQLAAFKLLFRSDITLLRTE